MFITLEITPEQIGCVARKINGDAEGNGVDSHDYEVAEDVMTRLVMQFVIASGSKLSAAVREVVARDYAAFNRRRGADAKRLTIVRRKGAA